MKFFYSLIVAWILTLTSIATVSAHTNGASAIHEVESVDAPTASLKITKDPTGGFNVQVVTSKFVWRPEMASMRYVAGEGHAHVYLDGRKIMRIYNGWFHLNTFQFATRSGEQLVSIELVGNDHAPYTIQGAPIGAEALVDVAIDEVGPKDPDTWKPIAIGTIVATSLLLILLTARTYKRKRSQG